MPSPGPSIGRRWPSAPVPDTTRTFRARPSLRRQHRLVHPDQGAAGRLCRLCRGAGAQPGRPQLRAVDHPARQGARGSRPQPAASTSNISAGSKAWCCTAISARRSSTTSRSATCSTSASGGRWRSPHLPCAGDADRRRPRHRRRGLPAPTRRPARLDDRLPRHDHPALLHGAGHPLLARLRRRLPVCRRHLVARIHLPAVVASPSSGTRSSTSGRSSSSPLSAGSPTTCA